MNASALRRRHLRLQPMLSDVAGDLRLIHRRGRAGRDGVCGRGCEDRFCSLSSWRARARPGSLPLHTEHRCGTRTDDLKCTCRRIIVLKTLLLHEGQDFVFPATCVASWIHETATFQFGAPCQRHFEVEEESSQLTPAVQ